MLLLEELGGCGDLELLVGKHLGLGDLLYRLSVCLIVEYVVLCHLLLGDLFVLFSRSFFLCGGWGFYNWWGWGEDWLVCFFSSFDYYFSVHCVTLNRAVASFLYFTPVAESVNV